MIAGPAPAGGQANDGEPPIERTAPPAIAALAKRYQPTLLVTVADQNWPTSVNAILDERGPADQPVCLVQQRSPHEVCPPSPSSLGGVGAQSSDYLQLPVRLARNQSPGGQFQAFLRGQYIASGSLHNWLADPGVLDPWRSAEIYFYYRGPVSISRVPGSGPGPERPLRSDRARVLVLLPVQLLPAGDERGPHERGADRRRRRERRPASRATWSTPTSSSTPAPTRRCGCIWHGTATRASSSRGTARRSSSTTATRCSRRPSVATRPISRVAAPGRGR